MNDKFVDEYDYENVQRKLRNSAKIEGYEEGKKQGITEIAKNMLREGSKIEFVSKVTKLSIEELNELK
ncbi:MAG: hypothetical protein NC096_05615 [Candidatus Amulumruptor caecigallinarius]|nr:hypothetical protein [Candidatus Amulumruptor caecigallinarius]